MDSKKIRKIRQKNFFTCSLLVLLGALFFTLANPNPVFKKGLSFFAWFMFVPYLLLIKKSFVKNCWFYSGLYGVLSVCGYAYWLYNYDSLCLYIAIPIAFFGTALLGLVLKAVEKLFFKNAWLVQFLVLCTFDYLRTLGFLGFHYGLAAYTQWNFNSFLQINSIIGVFGLNAIVIFSSAVIFAFISKSQDRKILEHQLISDDKHYEGPSYINYVSEHSKSLENASLKIPVVAACIWAVIVLACVIWGSIKLKKTEECPVITAVVIQNNDDPDENGLESFTNSINELMDLTDEAFEINPQIKLVIWPENAVVPSIIYHSNSKENTDRKKLVSYVLEYFNRHSANFIIGNQHIEVNDFTGERKYFNSAIFVDENKAQNQLVSDIYHKIHLVPFSEYFPYQKYFPHIYKAILSKQKFFSDPGNKISIFNTQGLSIYTPICFENTFPDLCREAYKNGARCFVCLVNDSWSKSESCQNEHLAMAKFRAIENNVPVAVSSVSGQTAFIDQNGKVISVAIPFTKSYVIGELPVIQSERKPTVYNKIGDVFGYGIAFLLLVVLIIRGLIAIINKVLCQNAQKH